MTPDYPLIITHLNNAGIETKSISEHTGICSVKLSKIKNEACYLPTTWQNLDIDDEMIQAVLLCILYKLTFNNRAIPDYHKPWD